MASQRTPAEQLTTFRLFNDCSADDLKALTRSSRTVTAPAHWTVIHDETPGDACYVILDGTATVKRGADVVAHLGPGDVAGEVALVTACLRTAAVVSESPMKMLHIDAAQFGRLIEDRPSLREALVRSDQS